MASDPLMSRERNPALSNTDLVVRGVPKVLIDVLDAKSIARGISRRDVLVQMLQREAKQFAHEHMVAQRVVGGQSVMQELADAKLEDEPQIGG